MIELGKVQELEILRTKEFGVYVGEKAGDEASVLLPKKQVPQGAKVGDKVEVFIYKDSSDRVYSHMSNQSPYKADDWVTGTVYEISEKLGAFVAVDNKYYGLIPKQELFGSFREGEEIQARVMKVREDGKLDLCARDKAYIQMSSDADKVLKVIDEFDGVLPFNDKAKPEVIMREFNMSKNAFKRAVGRLLKEGKVKITEKTIERI